jgi:hypothetical protein
LTDEQTIADFLNSFRQARAGPARPARQGPTPNDRSSCPPKSSEDERVEQIRSNIAERFKKSMRKAAQKESKTSVDISSSETETMAQPVKPILAKGMPTKGQKKSEIPESSAAASSSSASASKSAAIPAKEDRRKPVRLSAAKRETSARARELFKDADAAKEVFSKFKQEFTEIQWFQRPEGPQCCKNFNECLAEDAMFWCHPCGFALCLNCRVQEKACDHHIINYSSELGANFMPESISAKDPPFDMGQIIDTVLGQSSFFGATRKEHERTRQENFEDIVEALKHGRKFGNNYFQNFVQYGIEDFPFSDFVYSLPSGNRVPTLEKHFLEAQDATALPIWRPEIFFEYPDTELQEQEILDLLELFRCCLMRKSGKRAVSVGKSEMRKTPKTLKRTVTNLVSLLSTSDTSTVIGSSIGFHPGSARTTIIVLCHI